MKRKQDYKNSSGSQSCKLFFKWFLVLVRWKIIASPEIIVVKVYHRQTDRQTNSLKPYMGVCRFFASVKFATSLLGYYGSKQNILKGIDYILNNIILQIERLNFRDEKHEKKIVQMLSFFTFVILKLCWVGVSGKRPQA